MAKEYCIKSSYKCNPAAKQAFDAEKAFGNTHFFQSAVYEFAARKTKDNACKSVLDAGCGFGVKLAEFVFPVCPDITGIDFSKEAIAYNKKNLGFGKWFVVDLSNPKKTLNRKFDFVVCSDVLEHLPNPDSLLAFLKKHSSKNSFFVFSTPERDVVRGKDSFGPPENKLHVREWNFAEFEKYIKSNGFVVLGHFLADDIRRKKLFGFFSFGRKPKKTCQIAFCKKRQ